MGPGGPLPWQVENEPAVPCQPGGISLSWRHQAQHCQARKGLSCFALHWGSLTLNAGGSFGVQHHNIRSKAMKKCAKEAMKMVKGLGGEAV